MKPIEPLLVALMQKAVNHFVPSAENHTLFSPFFETPKEEKFGDVSSSFVMRAAKLLKESPRPLAEKVLAFLKEEMAKDPALAARIEKITIEGPGFLNFYYSVREKASVIEEIKEAGENYGKPPKDTKFKKILLEFVSANPTGPLTIAHGRQAALGDSLAMILKFYGHSVDKEYYNNDEGVQITTLGKSLLHRVGQLLGRDEFSKEMPENYYQGEYLIDIAKQFISKKGEDRIKKILSSTDGKPLQELFEECRCFARDHIMDGIKKDLADFGVSFDNYYSQEALGKSGKVEKTLEELRKKGFVEEKEGAVWFLSTRFGDDKDRVLVKSDKSYTYLTPDIAYHRDKLERKYESLINILGPDHHGYIARITAAIQAFGYPKEALEIKIAQLVTLFEGDKQLRMSTRAGEFVTLRELLDEVKKDAARFFFLMRRFDAHLDFDLELAKSQTMDNPVFYIQYAYARIENIKGLCAEKKLSVDKINPERFSLLSSVSELQLLRLMRQFPAAVKAAERDLEPSRITAYLQELAAAFHRFYTENRVVTDDPALTEARIMLVTAAQVVIRNGLRLLGVSTPSKM